jgi:hypothetical protein
MSWGEFTFLDEPTNFNTNYSVIYVHIYTYMKLIWNFPAISLSYLLRQLYGSSLTFKLKFDLQVWKLTFDLNFDQQV